MNLIEATFALALLILGAIALVYFLFYHVIFSSVTQQQAVALVDADIMKNYPGAEILKQNVTSSASPGSWHIVAAVVVNGTSPCPNYFVIAYDYPKFGFVSTPVNNYTDSCIIYGYKPGNYIVASFPVAIARATSLDIPSVIQYIKKYGYANVSVYATFYNTTKLSNLTYRNVWLVNYTAAARHANYSVLVVLTQLNGNVTKVMNVSIRPS
ncbi:MAG: hypothetical protein ACP5T4_01660 [Candidatus Micrarchaeia archaeon]